MKQEEPCAHLFEGVRLLLWLPCTIQVRLGVHTSSEVRVGVCLPLVTEPRRSLEESKDCSQAMSGSHQPFGFVPHI